MIIYVGSELPSEETHGNRERQENCKVCKVRPFSCYVPCNREQGYEARQDGNRNTKLDEINLKAGQIIHQDILVSD